MSRQRCYPAPMPSLFSPGDLVTLASTDECGVIVHTWPSAELGGLEDCYVAFFRAELPAPGAAPPRPPYVARYAATSLRHVRRLEPFAIRPATPADLDALVSIERAAAVRFEPFGLADVMATVVTPREDLERGARDGGLFVATLDGVPVGFALAHPLDGALHLDELDVLPAHGRRGLGRALVEAVVDLARRRDLTAVTLSTLRSVPWNAPWYTRLGFHVLAENAWTPHLRELVAHEAARGLPMTDRVLMRRLLDER